MFDFLIHIELPRSKPISFTDCLAYTDIVYSISGMSPKYMRLPGLPMLGLQSNKVAL